MDEQNLKKLKMLGRTGNKEAAKCLSSYYFNKDPVRHMWAWNYWSIKAGNAIGESIIAMIFVVVGYFALIGMALILMAIPIMTIITVTTGYDIKIR